MLLDNPDEINAITELLTQQPDGRLLLAEVDIGEDAAQFLKSDIGRYVVGRINIEIMQYAEKLQTTLPFRWRRITQLQNEIYKREALKSYLVEAINAGRSALAELSQRQAD